MHGADKFLCRNCVILKCEAVAPVGHCIIQTLLRGENESKESDEIQAR